MACPECQQRMDGQLVDVLEFYALAEGELLPGSGSGARGTERSLGVRLSALDFLAGHDAVTVLGLWESEWREYYDLSIQPMLARPEPLLARSVAFLRAWLPRACDDHPAVDDFAHELHDCWAEGRTAARCAPASTVTSVDCPADDDSHESGICGKRIGIDAEVRTVQCHRCRTVWDVPHLIHVALSMPGAQMWADPEAAARYFSLHEGTLRKWAAAGRIIREHGRYELHSIHAAIHGVSDTG